VTAEQNPLRLRRQLTHTPSDVIAELEQRIRADVGERRGDEFAEWWAGRVAANPTLRWIFSTPGYDPHGEAS